MSVITLEIPNWLFSEKKNDSPHPYTGKLREWANDAKNLRIAVDSFNGLYQHFVTTYAGLQNLSDYRKGYTSPQEPDYIDMLVYLLGLGVKFKPDITFKRGSNKYFQLDLFIKLSNDEYTNGLTPVGTFNSVGTGESGDAAIDTQRTWEQWAKVNQSRIEDDVLVTQSGAKVLSNSLPRHPDEIEVYLQNLLYSK